jgi:hypothetical protein
MGDIGADGRKLNIGHKEIWCGGVKWIYLTRDMV